ncbi:hypothetical protein BGZ75_004544 [Mortierella antarctica]|nr:hypothetical protein BGZ75_004544 [Mortierella antarctica]
MVPAYNGTKMVVFGGVNVARQTVAGIYVLDVETMIWTKGKDIDPLLSRSDMACSVAGDNFIAWGGNAAGPDRNDANMKRSGWKVSESQ